MPQYIVILDTPSIKSYIFESTDLKDIRGASAILDGLNRGWLLEDEESNDESEKIYDRFIYEKTEGKVKLKEFIYANGGSGMMIVETDNKAALESLENAFEKVYREKTSGGATHILAWTEYDDPENFRKDISQVHWELRQKRSKLGLSPSLTTPWCRFDDKLTRRRAEVCGGAGDTAEEKHSWVSQVTLTRKKAAFGTRKKATSGTRKKATSGTRKVWDELKQSLPYCDPPQTLQDIADAGASKKEIAIVYADGNTMGQHIKKLNSPEEYRAFSTVIDKSVRQATYKTLKLLIEKIFSTDEGKNWKKKKEEEERRNKKDMLPVDIILLGGDDILLVLPPEFAVPFVIGVKKEFEQQVKALVKDAKYSFLEEHYREKNYTISFGISYANSHAPFNYIVEQAESCLKKAKAKYGNKFAVDFHSNISGFFLDVEAYRKISHVKKQSSNMLHLTQRPYTIEKFAEIVEKTLALKEKEVPSSRFHAIVEGARTSMRQGHFSWITGVGRARNDEQKKALRDLLNCWGGNENHSLIPWKRKLENRETHYHCGLEDVLELLSVTSADLLKAVGIPEREKEKKG